LHEGLDISREEYDALLQHAKTTLDAVGVGNQEKDDVLRWMTSLKGEMVERR
jgi:hypothetical protein